VDVTNYYFKYLTERVNFVNNKKLINTNG
jgi:hypothetical protein